MYNRSCGGSCRLKHEEHGSRRSLVVTRNSLSVHRECASSCWNCRRSPPPGKARLEKLNINEVASSSVAAAVAKPTREGGGGGGSGEEQPQWGLHKSSSSTSILLYTTRTYCQRNRVSPDWLAGWLREYKCGRLWSRRPGGQQQPPTHI